jgi:hypothetical protein
VKSNRHFWCSVLSVVRGQAVEGRQGESIGKPAGLSTGLAGCAVLGNLVPVTLGNVVGGGVLVALVYWVIYLRGKGPVGG